MRILHVTFENFQDVPGLLSRSHSWFGDQGVLATMTRSSLGFPNGIMLDYPLLNSNSINIVRKAIGRQNVNVPEKELKLKLKWESNWQGLLLKSRDLLWLHSLHRCWRKYDLADFDIYHFDGDLPFVNGERILKKLRGKKIVTHFFGSDLRKWGMNPYLREYAGFRITSELDHTRIDPDLFFVPIPFEADRFEPRKNENKTLRVGHSPTRRTAKGTSDIIKIVGQLQRNIKFEWVLIEGVPNRKCLEIKRTCDIGIDQVGNYAGTGYGRSGLEFLALGVPTITETPADYNRLLPGYPFVNANKKNLADVLHKMLVDAQWRHELREKGLRWVREFPNPKRIMGEIYGQYRRLGWK